MPAVARRTACASRVRSHSVRIARALPKDFWPDFWSDFLPPPRSAVRFGVPGSVMAAGEGIETTLSLLCALPGMSMAAALSAAHLSAILFPPTLRRLYVIRDNDQAGDGVRDTLIERAREAGIDKIVLSPRMGDFNDDLCHLGLDMFRTQLADQLMRRDRIRYLARAA